MASNPWKFVGGDTIANARGGIGGHGGFGPVGQFLHWVWYGQKRGSGLDVVPGQLAASFDPRTKEGLANLASMLYGGGDSPMEGRLNAERFGDYDLGQAYLDSHLGHMKENQPATFRNSNLRRQHDILFGGEVHSRGEIPRQPGAPIRRNDFVEPPRSAHEVATRIFQRRRQLDERLGSAPMHHAEQPYRDVSHEGMGLRHPDTLHHIVKTILENHHQSVKNMARYRAQLGHNHLN